ncbi:adenylyltransferase/cytidyltransferase family protein [Candidatus Woesearchaeota archaeon]|nr:adenylyltransferase/cytidyltransferase family protein [Candidatus Woesearchaeota archaeon]
MSTALVLGRFQPFHKGHLFIIKEALCKHENVIVAVGSAQYSRTKRNPFSFRERKAMIAAATKGLSLIILPLPDIHSDKEYVTYVRKSLPWFDEVYAGNQRTLRLFRESGLKIHQIKRIEGISATRVRNALHKQKVWEKFVPPATATILKKMKAPKIIKGLYI